MHIFIAKFAYNEYIRPCFLIARCFYNFCQWTPRPPCLLLNEGNILSLGDDLNGGLINKKINPDLFPQLLPLKITIAIPIIINYIT